MPEKPSPTLRNRHTWKYGGTAAFCIASVFVHSATAQCPGFWRPAEPYQGPDAFVFALTIGLSDEVFVGGQFDMVGEVSANRIARYDLNSAEWSPLGGGLAGGLVRSIAITPTGDVVAGGSFLSAGGTPANRIAIYSPVTESWSPLGSGAVGDSSSVLAMAVLDDGSLVAGGTFSSIGGVRNKIARCDLETGIWTPLGSGVNDTVYALKLLSDGTLAVGGSFTTAGGLTCRRIAIWNPASGDWLPLGTGTNSSVRAIEELPDGDLVAAGEFSTAGGIAAAQIARYSRGSALWTPLGSGLSNQGSCLAVLPDGDIAVGGLFLLAGGVRMDHVARFDWSTSQWSPFGGGTYPSVFALACVNNQELIVGGTFGRADGGANVSSFFAGYVLESSGPQISLQPESTVVCNVGSVELSVELGPSPPSGLSYQWQVEDPAVESGWSDLSDGSIVIASETTCFSITGVQESIAEVDSMCAGVLGAPSVLRFRCLIGSECGSATSDSATVTRCAVDFDCSGGVAVPDIFSFLASWFAGDQRADADGDLIIGVPDVFSFLGAWFAGCE